MLHEWMNLNETMIDEMKSGRWTKTVDKLMKSGKHIWTADDLLPAFTYVVVRSQIRHLGTEILLIDNFSRDFRGSGEISMMFTMLQSSYHIICNEKNRI
ncbi:unnamed protein product [Auanema sp. JU1783]|nr:unnamed protein product [Auanema sp. JU1783]